MHTEECEMSVDNRKRDISEWIIVRKPSIRLSRTPPQGFAPTRASVLYMFFSPWRVPQGYATFGSSPKALAGPLAGKKQHEGVKIEPLERLYRQLARQIALHLFSSG